ncbi:MAG: small multi-drug export protein [Desulfurococcaceae archaeon]
MQGDVKDIVISMLIAILPVSEIRGALPYIFITTSDSHYLVLGIVLSVLSNMAVPFIAFKALDIIDMLVRHRRTPIFVKSIYYKILEIGNRKAVKLRKESYIALALFVGIPLPATGAWTGTLVAYILGLDRKKSIMAIEIGVLMASSIVLIATLLGATILKTIFMF